MRLRIRGPLGQSVVNLDDTATVDSLKKIIATETSLTSFAVKYGYPLKDLPLDQYSDQSLLSELEIKLSGEQLIVSRREAASTRKTPDKTRPDGWKSPSSVASSSEVRSGQAVTSGPTCLPDAASVSMPDSNFTFGNLGTAPSPVSAPSPATEGVSSPTAQSLPRKKYEHILSDPPEIILPEAGGSLVLRIMPDDNSCLFRAVASAVMPGIDTMNELRSVVAQTIQANPDKYSKVVLDNKEPDDYCRWIQTEAAWGGQIELDILSRHFDVEICSIDVQRLRVDRYNEGVSSRCLLVYSGIHYDTIAFSPFGLPPEYDVKIFESTEDVYLSQAVVLCEKLQEKHYFTDTAAFTIKCNDCGVACMGETGATEHASTTGHYNFGEAA